jgi:flagellar FliL protein
MSKAATAIPESADSAAGAAPKKKGKKLLFIIVGLVLVLGVAAAAAFVIISKRNNATPGAHAAEKKHVEKKPPVFTALEPFTVNLADREREHYLQIGLTYEVGGDDIGEEVKAQMPLIRSKILLLLTSKTAMELSTPEGKIKLVHELVALARTAVADSSSPNAKGPEHGIADVHFSAFIIQ